MIYVQITATANKAFRVLGSCLDLVLTSNVNNLPHYFRIPCIIALYVSVFAYK